MDNRLLNVVSVFVVVAMVTASIVAYCYGQVHKNDKSVAQAAIDAEVAEAAKRGTLQELPPGKKLEGFTTTGPKGLIVYLVRPMRPDEAPEVYELSAYEADSETWVVREHADEQR